MKPVTSRSLVRTVALVGVLVTSAASPAFARQQCADIKAPVLNATRPFSPIVQLSELDCLGGSRDQTPLTRDVLKIVKGIRPATTKAVQSATDAAEVLRSGVLEALDTIHGSASAHELPPVLASQVAFSTAFSLIVPNIVAARALDTTAAARTQAWTLDNGTVSFGDAQRTIGLQAGVEEACRASSDACTAAFVFAQDVVRTVNLVHRALAEFDKPQLVELLKENTTRSNQWDAYFDQARSQYIWELMLNGRRLKDDRQEVDGVKQAFRSVPNDQVTFLHPDIAFEYAADEPNGNRFAGTVVFDVIGYNRWKWKTDGSMGPALGASFIIAATDHAAMKDVGYGFMVHINHRFSAGMTFGGSSRTILMSTDVAKLWTKASETRKQLMARVIGQ